MIPVGILTAAATSSFSFLLNDYPGAAAAYSLRKLRSAYTGSAIRVRRTIGLQESLDIGFLNNVLDTTTLLTFCGAGDGVVTIWYDQSGNGNNATTTGVQPPDIVLSGVLQTQNSKPCIKFNSLLGTRYFDISTPIAANTNLSIFMTAKGSSLTDFGPMLGALGAPTVFFGYFSSAIGSDYALGAGLNGAYNFVRTVPNYANTNYLIFNCIINSSNYTVYQNNNTFTQTLNATALSPQSFSYIGRYFNFTSNAIYSELIFYKTDQSANRIGIINNTNTFYTIF